MPRPRPLALGLASGLALLLAPPALAQAPPPPPQIIEPGTRAAGVDVGGLSVPDAAARIAQLVGGPIAQPIVISVAGERSELSARRLGTRLDAERTAKRAFYTARKTAEPVDVPAAVRFRRSVVSNVVTSFGRRVRKRARNADVDIQLRRIRVISSREGRALNAGVLRAGIIAAVTHPAMPRYLTPGRRAVKPKVTADELPRRYPTIVTIDRDSFRLRLFKRLKLSKSYPIAVGAAGYDTPTGLYSITNKAVNPAWSAPDSPWAGLYRGTVVPGGAPNNPLKARWLGIYNGVGIHGTGDPGSIGTRASHGCIRMTVPDVIDLYPRVPVGAPVLIG